MASKNLDRDTLRPLLTALWSNYFGASDNTLHSETESVMFDGLEDDIEALQYHLDEANKKAKILQVVTASSIADNRNGLLPNSTAHLSVSHADTNSVSKSTTNTVKVGYEYSVKVEASMFGSGTASEHKFSLEYNWSSTSTDTQTIGDTFTVTHDVPMTVPSGRIYKAVLLCTQKRLDVPYSLTLKVKGQSGIWFDQDHNGHRYWFNWIGLLFEQLKNPNYKRIPEGNGLEGLVVAQAGVLTSQYSVDFHSEVWDITDAPHPDVVGMAVRSWDTHDTHHEAAPPPGARVIARYPLHGRGTPAGKTKTPAGKTKTPVGKTKHR